MNIKQILQHQKSLISQFLDDNAKALASHDYRTWLAESLGKTQSFLIAHDDYELSESELETYQNGLAKLQQGVPLAYVTGHQPFWLGDFLVNEHTLIPRADTEVLVKVGLDFLAGQGRMQYSPTLFQEKLSILDMGTGSGCVAISLAMSLLKTHKNFQVTATDFSHKALQVAKQNANLNNVSIHFLQGDWFSPFSSEQKFHLVVSNPPYIDPQDPHLADLKDEPITALTAENHGLADIFSIIDGAKNHLHDGGLLAIEHGYDQGDIVRDYFIQHGFHQVVTQKDYANNDRVTSGIYLKND